MSYLISTGIFLVTWFFQPVNHLIGDWTFGLGDTFGFIIIFTVLILIGELPLFYLDLPKGKKYIIIYTYPFIQFIIFVVIMLLSLAREF